MPPEVSSHDERGLGDVIRDLAQNIQALIRGELALVRLTMSDRAKEIAPPLACLAIAALLVLAGTILLVGGGAAFVALWMPIWAALLLTGLIVVAIALLIAWRAVRAIGETTARRVSIAGDVATDLHALKDELA